MPIKRITFIKIDLAEFLVIICLENAILKEKNSSSTNHKLL